MAEIHHKSSKDEEFEGASPSEQVIEACRRNNTELLHSLIEACPNPEAVAKLLNESKSVMGNYAYHEAALNGNYEVIDLLLDQPDFECDPVAPRTGDTPLHSIVRWVNEAGSQQNRDYGAQIVEMMLEAGGDARARNRARLTPKQLVDPSNRTLYAVFDDHEYALLNKGDFIESSNNGGGGDGQADGDDGARGGKGGARYDAAVGSASDSD